MTLQADITTAITEAGQSKTATEAVVVGIVAVAPEVNMTEVRVLDDTQNPGKKDVRVIVSLRATNVAPAIAADLEELFALTRGTR